MSKLAAAGLSSTVAGAPPARAGGRAASASVTAAIEVPARSMCARPAAANALASSAPLSPMSTTAAVTRSATTRASSSMATPLERPPPMSTSGRREAAQGGDDRVRLGALRVVHVAHAVDRRRPAPGDARRRGSPPRARRMAVRRDAEEQARRRRRRGRWRRCASPGSGISSSGRMRPLRPGRGESAAGDRQRSHRRGHDPAVDDADAAGAGRLARDSARPGVAPAPCVAAHDRVLVVEHQRTVGGAAARPAVA